MVLMGKGGTNRHVIQHIKDGWIQANKIKFKYINFNNEVENTFFVNNMCELYGNYNRDGNIQRRNYGASSGTNYYTFSILSQSYC